MLKKTVQYTNLRGEAKEKTCWFHLNRPELLKLEFSKAGGLGEWLNTFKDGVEPKSVLETLEKLILSSYGEISEDGERFDKSDTIMNNFKNSPIYEAVIMDLLSETDGTKIAEFVKGIIPEDLAREAEEAQKNEQKKNHPALK